ncbi:YceK/YidQ family lipoprotein [Erwinia amylovora]|uniref:Lipoprotein n=4 Tax=Erwinia amylovora TaxID=552 RepID=A0A831ELT6_ERWAM|nr:YceK/YidQ family lipoprotein [Erwinia amylovora]CBX82575.1 Uncharacterized protein yidQ precursor [Erwinia amylovora ATCC BAA-2158]CDK16956.1 putative protein yidQ precursor [Erwinia amylovora LA635]CDK20324.1 putative protein yidQ precursor [Erwinia amylovora LA636]CDK23695.1 putative protein yidQ precursor [Erwinia amylovora LA637]ATZ13170.1 YceK/YidQ family lipoprotein [Erwinia amylovora]
MKAFKRCHIAGVVACLSLASTGGCSSMMAHTGPNMGYYPGTRASAAVLTDENSSWIIRPMAAVDLPFSAILDTLLLPVDYITSGDRDSPGERVRRSEQANCTNAVMSQTVAPAAAGRPAQ